MGSSSKVVPHGEEAPDATATPRNQADDHCKPVTPRGFLPPNSPYRAAWDLGLLALVLYVCFELPIALAFVEHGSSSSFATVNYIIDTLFAVDILINFRTGRINRWGEVRYESKEIARGYLRGWFVVDMLGTIPFELLADRIVLRLPRMLRIGRLARKFKEIVSNNYLRLGSLILMFVLAGHWTACVGFYIAREAAGHGHESWITREFPMWNVSAIPMRDKYVTSMYWAMTTLTTVGYGDVVPANDHERAYAIVILTLGAVIYATVFANVTSVIAELDSSGSKYKERVSAIREFFRLHDLPDKLMERTVSYVDAAWSVEKGIDIGPVLDELPHNVREDIMMRLHGQEVRNMSFFQFTNKAFLRAVVTKLRPQVCLEGDFVVRKGDLALEMYFLHKGRVRVMLQEGPLDLEEGSFFGEAALLHWSGSPPDEDSDEEEAVIEQALARRRNANVIAATFCYMFALRAADFEEVIQAFPELRGRTKELLEQRGRRDGSSSRDLGSQLSLRSLPMPTTTRAMMALIRKHRQNFVVPKEMTLAASLIQLGWRQYRTRKKMVEEGAVRTRTHDLTEMLQLSVFHKRLRRVTQAKTGWQGSISALKKATEHQVDLLRSQVQVMQADFVKSIEEQERSMAKVAENMNHLRSALQSVLLLHQTLQTGSTDGHGYAP